MRATAFLTAAAVLALAACGSSDTKGSGNGGAAAANSTAEADVAAPPAGSAPGQVAIHLQPGQWETTVEAVNIEAPGMPAQARAIMAKAIGGGGTVKVSHCVTPEEANRPSGDVFAGKKNANCTYKNFSAAGGRVKGEMSCAGAAGERASMTLKMDGQFNPQSYSVNQTMTTDAGGSTMTIESRVTGRRTGDCRPGQQD